MKTIINRIQSSVAPVHERHAKKAEFLLEPYISHREQKASNHKRDQVIHV